jgi:hypothetical protein
MKALVKIAIGVGALAVLAGGAAAVYFLRDPAGDGKENGGDGRLRPAATVAVLQAEERPNVAAVLERLNHKVTDRTRDYLYPAKIMVETTAWTLSRHTRIYKDPFLEKYLLAMLDAYPQLDYVYVADREGNRLLAAENDVLGRFTSLTVRSGTKQPYRLRRRWDASGKLLSTERHSEEDLLKDHRQGGKLGGLNAGKTGIYDPLVRPWYRLAAERRALCWTDVYIFNQNQMPGITAACPAVSGRDVLFVVAADFEVRTICKFLRETKGELGKKGTVFIINYPRSDPKRRGELVAYPVESRVVTTVEVAGTGPAAKRQRPVFAKARDVVADYVKEALQRYEKAQAEGEDLRAFRFSYRKKSYIASFAPFLQSFGNDWKIVVVVPEDDLLSAETEAQPGE